MTKAALILFASLFLTLPSGVRLAVPLTNCPQGTDCFQSFTPIRHSYRIGNDDYFYYSRIREVMNGRFFSGDSVTLENRYKYTPHITYAISLIFGGVAGLFDGRTEVAYVFNNTFYVFLLYLVTIVFVFEFIGSWTLSALITAASILPLGMSRFPNIQFTSIPLTILFIFSLRTFKSSTLPTRNLISVALLLGTAILISIPNFFISFAVWTALCVNSVRRRTLLKRSILALMLGAVFAIPGLLLFREGMRFEKEWVELAIPPVDQYRGFKWNLFLDHMRSVYFPPWVFIMLLVSYPMKRVLVGLHVTLLALYFVLTLIYGSFFARYTHLRGADIFFAIEPWVFGSLWLKQILPPLVSRFEWLSSRLSMKGIYRGGVAGSTLVFVVLIAFYTEKQRNEISAVASYYHDADFKQLANWSLHSTNDEEVVVTLDFDIVINLPAYSPLNLYIPWAHGSPVKNDERLKRLFQTFRFYGLGTSDVSRLFREMKPHWDLDKSPDPHFRQQALMQLAVFYGPYTFEPMTEPEVEEMTRAYAEFLSSNSGELSFRADYLILSKVDEDLVEKNSPADLLIRSKRPVFQNGLYRAYRLN